MEITIQNEKLSVTVDTLGAQLKSICSADGCEYLWQGDPAYWADRAPVLFPVIARLYGEKYLHCGQQYNMGIHGFAAKSPFSVACQSRDQLVLRLESNEKTQSQYPFNFVLEISYQLQGASLQIGFCVCNTGSGTMSFAIGGHPGFRVPLEEGLDFSDYTLEFAQSCVPDRVLFTQQVLLSGQTAPYPLENGRSIRLCHELFDEDAIILQNTARQVTLCSKGSRKVTVSFPQMPYLGFWHRPKTDAPYVCIEPWSSLPGRQDVVEELSCRSDLIHLEQDKQYINNWSITVE